MGKTNCPRLIRNVKDGERGVQNESVKKSG